VRECHRDIQELVEALRNILDNDGGEGSKCYNASRLFDARQAAIEALSKWEGK
ncbi:MAG: hypothetical protein RLZ93_879, partial [Bacteroidota bacterium]